MYGAVAKTMGCVAGPSFFRVELYARYLASSFFRIRRSSIKHSAVVVQITQPIMMITFMSIRAGSCPVCAVQVPPVRMPEPEPPVRKIQQKLTFVVAILVS
jgi:hypothetical protein